MRGRHRHSGFTLVEMLIVGSILLGAAAIGIPALLQMFSRTKLQGAAQQVATNMVQCRMEVLRMGQRVVLAPIYTERSFHAFIDDDDDRVFDAGEEEIFRVPLPAEGRGGVYLMGLDGVEGTASDPEQSVDGFSAVGATSQRVVVFEPDGSVVDAGAFRLSDGRDTPNLFEVRIDPAGTARVEIRKFVFDGPDGDDFYAQGGNVWKWY